MEEAEARWPEAAPRPPDPLTFRAFVDLVRPGYRWYRHCKALADVLQRVAEGELRRVMVFEPPRHGKSEAVSRLFPAYYLYRYPERWVGVNSYSAELAYTFSRAARANYLRCGGRITDNVTAVKHWETGLGGGLWAAGVGGAITGKGFQLGIIDDPLKNAEQAASQTIREKQKDWYASTFYTREEPGGAQIICQTRWDEDDLAGWLLSQETEEADEPDGLVERWHIVNLAAVCEADGPAWPPTCTVEPDWREEGAPLCPERYPLERLERIKARVGAYYWGALFQQRPRPREGRIFKEAWFQERYINLPELLEVWSCWDTALKAKQQNDETACVTVGRGADGFLYVLRVVHGHWETPDVAAFLVRQAEWLRDRFGDRYRGDYVEDKVSGTTLMQYLRRTRPDVTLIPVSPGDQDKVARSHGVTPTCEAGQVRLPDPGAYPAAAAGVGALLEQLMAFPGARDDMVDAFVYAVKRFLGTLNTRARGTRQRAANRRGGLA